MSFFRSKLSAAAPLSVLALFAVTGHGQLTLGTVSGTVTDTSGASISGAQITITNNSTSLTFSAQTKDNGSYAFQNLPIGSYTVTVLKDGFDQQNYPNIQVQENRTVSLNAQLKAGKVSESVTVTAVPLLNATDTTNGYVLDNAQIQQIPLATGSFTQLAILSPGVNAEFIAGTGTNEGLGNQPIWANGQRDTDNAFLVNGVDVSNLFNGKSTSAVASARVTPNTGEGQSVGGQTTTNTSIYDAIGNAIPSPPPDTISELRVNTSMYDAQQGQKSGAHIDVSTTSGTNSYHGVALVQRETNFLNAAPFFYKQNSVANGGSIPNNDVNPYLHRVVAGATLGGPIIKDRLFGFISYQAIRITDQLNGTSQAFVPSGLTDDRSTAGINAAIASTLPANTPIGPLDPAAVNLLNFKLPNGQYMIPSASAGAAASLSNSQADAFLTGQPSFAADQANANLDYNASKSDVVSLKYFYQHDPTTAPFAISTVSGFNQHLDSGGQLAAVLNTYTKNRLSWTQSFGFAREKAYSYNDQALTAQQAGISLFGFTKFPGINIRNPAPGSTGSLNLGPASDFVDDGFFQNRFQPSTTAITTFGNHTISFGGDYAYTQLNIANRRQNTGQIQFANFANFAEGVVNTGNGNSTFLQGASNRYYRTNDVGAFAQDKWRLRSNISITAGVRYDYNGPLTEKYGNLFNFNPTLYQYDEGSDTIVNDGFVIAGNNKLYHTPGTSASTLNARQWGIAPRVGVAWSPSMNNGRIVFRAGYGLYYNRGEYFSYLSPGAGGGVGGPFGVTQTPPFAVPFNAPKGATLSVPFGTTLPNPPTGNPQDFYNYLSNKAGLVSGNQTYNFAYFNDANKLPYTQNISLDMQWQVNPTTSATIGYVGNRGRHGVIPVPFNQPGIATPQNPIHGETYSYGSQATDSAGNYLTTEPDSTYDGGNTDIRAPYLGYGISSVSYNAAGVSSYDALQASVQKRFSHGLQFNVSYTFSHSLDEQSGLGLFYNGNNPLNLRSGYASSDFDRTHDVTFNYVYQLPDFIHSHSVLSRVTNGFGIQGITVFQSGQPYSIYDYSGAIANQYYFYNDNATNPLIPLAPGVSPSQALTGHSGAFGTPALNANDFTIPFVNPGVNGVPACGLSTAGNPVCDVFETGFGPNGQRNVFRQAFQKRADISVVKLAKITETISAKFSLDIFNVSNTTSFDVPNNNLNTATNLNYTNTYNPNLSVVANRQTVFNIQNNGVNVSPTSGLGNTTGTIGSPRQIEMSFRLMF